jgi:hypothetical protein
VTQHTPISLAKSVELTVLGDDGRVSETDTHRADIQIIERLDSIGESFGHFVLHGS